jgi:drug/metabolite transporter (DMT)-like permease
MTQGQDKELERTPLAVPSFRYAFVGLLIGNVFLALGPIFVRMADTGPVAAGFWRMALAVPLLIVIARVSGSAIKMLSPSAFWIFALSGLFFAADLAAWHLGIFQTKLANANMLGNVTSFLLPLWLFVTTRTWPTRMQAAALLIAALGSALLMGQSFELSARNFTGDILCLLAGIFYTAYLVIIANARSAMGAWPVLAWSSIMTVLPLLGMALLMRETIIPSDWTPLLLLALCSQVIGQGLMIYALGRVPAVVFGITLLIQPIISAALGWYLYREAMTPLDWAGALMIGLALLIVRQPDQKPD